MLILVGLAAAAEPVLGPNGWTLLGPLVGDAARDEVVFDTDTCGVEIARVDLDAGPGARDLRLARRWVSGRWEWEDDWRVEDGELRRPGRRPVPVGSELRFAGETLGLDSEGRVVRRERDGRVIEILRGNRGEFEGMRSGAVWVRIDGTVGRSWDGREVRWRWEDGELRSVADSSGLTVAYTWAEGAPLVVRWPDGNELAFSLGKSRSAVRGVVSGACELRGAGQVAVTLAAGLWNVARDGERVVVTDPGGAVVRARYAHDRLVGWMDPRGGETRIERDASGNVTSVTDPGGGRWGFTWEGGLTGVEGPDGARWAVGRGSRGVASVGEPSGRAATWERVEGGAIRSVTLGAARWEVARDGAGRVVAVTDPTGARVEVGRDAQGRAENVRDPSGGAWRLSRDASGWLVGLDDPAQGSWRVERDPVGRVVGLRTPEGGRVRWSWRPDGLPARVAWDGAPWELLWSGLGLLSGIRDPLGGTTGFERDSGGRVTTVRRADGEVVRIGRDPAGDIVRVDGVGVRRDAAGRAQGLPELETWWDLDPSGRVVGVSAPGVRLRLEREAGGAIRAVVAGDARTGLTRDAQGRVVGAAGDSEMRLTRDAAGRVSGIEGAESLRIERDVRGLVSRLTREGEESRSEWTWGRDALGRLVEVEGPRARLGVDRDGLGRPTMVRFPDGSLARYERAEGAVRLRWTDRDGAERALTGWVEDALGRLTRVTADGSWLLRRDPTGLLVAAEQGERAWSRAPDGIEGPDVYVRYDATGRPARAQGVDAWGLGGELTYTLGPAGEVTAVQGKKGVVRLRYDAVGRLVEARGPSGALVVSRDALGRPTRAGRRVIGGFAEAFWGSEEGVRVEGAAEAGATSTLLAPDGGALWSLAGPVPWSPAGARPGGGFTVGGRLAAGPLLGLSDARDPLTGQELGPILRFPWSAPEWEPPAGEGPLADPDACSPAGWDPGSWAPESPWSTPLALLVAVGDLPDGGPRATRAPGLPWLPASVAPAVPEVLPDPLALEVDEEPLVELLVHALMAPTKPPTAQAIARALVPLPVPVLPPGLAPPTPY